MKFNKCVCAVCEYILLGFKSMYILYIYKLKTVLREVVKS